MDESIGGCCPDRSTRTSIEALPDAALAPTLRTLGLAMPSLEQPGDDVGDQFGRVQTLAICLFKH